MIRPRKTVPVDPAGYPDLQPGRFVTYTGAPCGLKTGEVAIIVRRSAEGLMRNTFARITCANKAATSFVCVPAHDVAPIVVARMAADGWPEAGS